MQTFPNTMSLTHWYKSSCANRGHYFNLTLYKMSHNRIKKSFSYLLLGFFSARDNLFLKTIRTTKVRKHALTLFKILSSLLKLNILLLLRKQSH